MAEIEQRIETRGIVSPKYAERAFSEEEVARGEHRRFVGGQWDALGQHQLDFLTRRGLAPGDTFLDVGCGALRAGRHLIDALEPGHYYGVDANLSLLNAGYDVELSDAQRARLPVANLRANDRFDVDFGVRFDMAIAQSVFTHLSLNHLRLCLVRVGRVMRPGGRFYVTFFEQPAATPLDKIVIRREGGRPFLSEQNVYWYYRQDLAWAAKFGPWRLRYIGDWGHPVGQMMAEYTRLDDDAAPSPRPGAGSASAAALSRARVFARRGRRWLGNRVAGR